MATGASTILLPPPGKGSNLVIDPLQLMKRKDPPTGSPSVQAIVATPVLPVSSQDRNKSTKDPKSSYATTNVCKAKFHTS